MSRNTREAAGRMSAPCCCACASVFWRVSAPRLSVLLRGVFSHFLSVCFIELASGQPAPSVSEGHGGLRRLDALARLKACWPARRRPVLAGFRGAAGAQPNLALFRFRRAVRHCTSPIRDKTGSIMAICCVMSGVKTVPNEAILRF